MDDLTLTPTERKERYTVPWWKRILGFAAHEEPYWVGDDLKKEHASQAKANRDARGNVFVDNQIKLLPDRFVFKQRRKPTPPWSTVADCGHWLEGE